MGRGRKSARRAQKLPCTAPVPRPEREEPGHIGPWCQARQLGQSSRAGPSCSGFPHTSLSSARVRGKVRNKAGHKSRTLEDVPGWKRRRRLRSGRRSPRGHPLPGRGGRSSCWAQIPKPPRSLPPLGQAGLEEGAELCPLPGTDPAPPSGSEAAPFRALCNEAAIPPGRSGAGGVRLAPGSLWGWEGLRARRGGETSPALHAVPGPPAARGSLPPPLLSKPQEPAEKSPPTAGCAPSLARKGAGSSTARQRAPRPARTPSLSGERLSASSLRHNPVPKALAAQPRLTPRLAQALPTHPPRIPGGGQPAPLARRRLALPGLSRLPTGELKAR